MSKGLRRVWKGIRGVTGRRGKRVRGLRRVWKGIRGVTGRRGKLVRGRGERGRVLEG